jgi:protoporphyrinogen oxidase
MEYFSNEGDEFWRQSDAEIAAFAAQELQKINLVDEGDVLDSTVIRQLKAYPTYTGAYSQFKEIRAYLNTIENLFPIGRNGMHKYNNQDHSMLTAMAAVDVAIKGSKNKDHIWDINAEQEYHE